MRNSTRLLRYGVTALVCCGASGELYGRDGKAPEAKSGRQINNDHRGTYQAPSPVVAVEDKDQASRREDATDGTEQRQRDELTAQQASAAAAERSATAAQESAQFSMFGSLFGLISVILLAWTLWFTRSTAKAASTSAAAAKDSAGAAIDSADTAKKALGHSQKSFELGRRPLIAFEGFAFGFPDNINSLNPDGTVGRAGAGATISGTIRNYGASPAMKTSNNLYLYYMAPDDTPTMPETMTGATIAIPQGAVRGTGTQSIWHEQWDKAFSGEAALYAIGIVDYEDGFTAKKHITRTGIRIRPSVNFETARFIGKNPGMATAVLETLPDFDSLT